MSRLSFFAALAICVSSSVSAQSSLGITGFEATAGGFSGNDGGTSFSANLTLDVAVTEYHGLQGDLACVDTPSGAVGRVAGHIYMTPRPGQKYGVFALVGDVNDRSLTYAAAGIEGMFEVSDRTAIGGYAGAGMGSVDGLDVIFGGFEASHVLSDSLRLDAGIQITEYDEIGLQAIGTETRLGLRYSPKGQPFSISAGVVNDMLTGPDGAPSETRAEVNLSWRFGTINGTAPTSRPFTTPDPILPLVRRGLY